MNSLIDIFGKFHPLVLHLPIGILVYAYLHLIFDLYISKKEATVDFTFALGAGALFAIFSSISGYLLSINGEYGGELLDWHKWLGIGTAIGAILVFVLYKKLKNSNSFFAIISMFMVLLGATGHYGGSLTHGEGFLIPTNQESAIQSPIEDVSKAHVFNDLIMPIVDQKCLSCHNPKKKKGELLLNTIAGWKQGGKTGAFIIPGDPGSSAMLTRVHLPLTEKKHMPPSGKLQLDKEEISFIDWWIGSMTGYNDLVSDLKPPVQIKKFIDRKLDYSTRNVPPISQEEIFSLQQSGLPVRLMSEGKPWISVAFKSGGTVRGSELKRLSKYKENVRILKLSNTKITDKLLSRINDFSNLQRLDLSQNNITSTGVNRLEALENLESLNLYKTKVDKAVLDDMINFPKLKDLYLWQTQVTKSDLNQADLPVGLNVNIGQDLSMFGDVQFPPPTIESKIQIFKDTIEVRLNHVSKKANIYYTLNGEKPDSNSTLYSKPIIIDKTSELNVMAKMSGWMDSEIVQKSFFRSSNVPVACNISPAPSDKYKGDGNTTIINGIKGTEQFADGNWLGFSGEDVSITLDLGAEKTMKSISFGALRDFGSYIFTPIGAKVSTSQDGITFNKIKEETYPQITQPENNRVVDYIISFPEVNLRYVKLDLIGQKKNPSWHSAPGADSWLFLDEVVLE